MPSPFLSRLRTACVCALLLTVSACDPSGVQNDPIQGTDSSDGGGTAGDGGGDQDGSGSGGGNGGGSGGGGSGDGSGGGSASNTAPVADAVGFDLRVNEVLRDRVTASDADGDPLTYALVDAPQTGAVTLDSGGAFTYTPGTDFVGNDQFSFMANDGQVDSAPAVVSLSITRARGLFRVGTGTGDQTPESPTCVGSATLCGRQPTPEDDHPDDRDAHWIRDPLQTRALAITGENGDTLILVSTTNIGYFLAYKPENGGPNGIYDTRLRIAEQTGVDFDNIIVISDHSHNGPDTIGIWGGVSTRYMEIQAQAVVDAAVAAHANQRDAVISVASVNQTGNSVFYTDADGNSVPVPILDSSYSQPPARELDGGNPENEFRMLVADDPATGNRIATLMNYAPHATVINGVARHQLTGDWAAWGPQEANALFGGFGFAAIGTVGGTDWNKTEDPGGDHVVRAQAREDEARRRLRALMQAAQAQLQPVVGGAVNVDTTFIRETITQPVLLANYKAGSPTNQEGLPSEGFDVRIDRSVLPPFLTGSVLGTYVSAVRIGDVFLSTFPGEPFGELGYAIRNEGRVLADEADPDGASAHFVLGGAHDFFGYMVKKQETFQQLAQLGAAYPVCPEQEIMQGAGLEPPFGEYACNDHFTLMVSPSFGSHIVCTLQDGADRVGFPTANRDEECEAYTAMDGVAPPDDGGGAIAP